MWLEDRLINMNEILGILLALVSIGYTTPD